MKATTVRCHSCRETFPLPQDEAHRLRSQWERDGTRRTILCGPCTNRWPRGTHLSNEAPVDEEIQ